MPDLFNFSNEMQSYFDTLPPMVQECIAQSSAKVNSLADLKAIADTITGAENGNTYNQ